MITLFAIVTMDAKQMVPCVEIDRGGITPCVLTNQRRRAQIDQSIIATAVDNCVYPARIPYALPRFLYIEKLICIVAFVGGICSVNMLQGRNVKSHVCLGAFSYRYQIGIYKSPISHYSSYCISTIEAITFFNDS